MRKIYNLRTLNSNHKIVVRRNSKACAACLTAFAVIFIFFAVALFSPARVAYADDGAELNESIQSIIDSLNLTDIEKYLEEYGNSFVFNYGDSAKEIIEYLINGNLNVNFGDYLSEIGSVLLGGAKSFLPAFAQIIAISILCAVASDAQGGILSKTTAKAIRLACTSLIILILSSILFGIISSSVQCVTNIKKQIEIFTPILITLTVLTGGTGAGAVYQPAAMFLSQGAVELVSGMIFPATVAVIVLNFISKLNPDISFGGVAAFIKSVMKWIIGITVAVFGLFITVQGTSSSLFNGVFFKVTKYFVGNSVPIVGNFLSSGVDMVVMSGSIVRSSLGLLGIIALISQILQPVILLAAFSLILKITGALCQPIGVQGLYKLYSDLSKDVDYFIAGILMAAFMYILLIMIIINSSFAFI